MSGEAQIKVADEIRAVQVGIIVYVVICVASLFRQEIIRGVEFPKHRLKILPLLSTSTLSIP